MSTFRRQHEVPWHFRWAKWLIRRGIRGPGLVIRLAHRLGWLNFLARYPLSDRIAIDVPLYRPVNWWDLEEVRDYERPVLDCLVAAVAGRPRPLRLVDCGAEIGLFAALAAARVPDLAQVVALEPGEEAFAVLQPNIARLPLAGSAMCAAVSDFSGRATLERSPDDPSPHASFITAAVGGPIQVVRLDDLNLARDGTLILKLDIEGEELAALRGARSTLTAAEDFVVIFEAHRDVARRTGIDPVECLRLLAEIRPCEFQAAEFPAAALTCDRPFFEQLREARIVNVVCMPRREMART